MPMLNNQMVYCIYIYILFKTKATWDTDPQWTKMEVSSWVDPPLIHRWSTVDPPLSLFGQAGLVGNDAPERRLVAWASKPPAAWQELSESSRMFRMVWQG